MKEMIVYQILDFNSKRWNIHILSAWRENTHFLCFPYFCPRTSLFKNTSHVSSKLTKTLIKLNFTVCAVNSVDEAAVLLLTDVCRCSHLQFILLYTVFFFKTSRSLLLFIYLSFLRPEMLKSIPSVQVRCDVYYSSVNKKSLPVTGRS